MEVKTRVEGAFVDVLQLGNNAASHKIKTASARFLEKIVISFLTCSAADGVMSQGFERWSQLDTFMNAVRTRIVSITLFIRLLNGSMKQHVD